MGTPRSTYLRGAGAVIEGTLRKLQYYGNPEDWGDDAPHVYSNTRLDDHRYDAFRRYYEAATGTKMGTAGLNPRQQNRHALW